MGFLLSQRPMSRSCSCGATGRLPHMIRVLAAKEGVHLSETTDLFVEVDQDSRDCGYWFADHANRTIFWLHPVVTKSVGLPDSCSKYHLRESYTVSPCLHSVK
ncbi:hypothetical protein BJV77DRAFT_704579 [Russula vinacea]|nr:hypothetical protein BJV77DRAFT_704579 [Russula vinacea]